MELSGIEEVVRCIVGDGGYQCVFVQLQLCSDQNFGNGDDFGGNFQCYYVIVGEFSGLWQYVFQWWYNQCVNEGGQYQQYN